MSEDGKKYMDPELEKFLKENKEMLKRLFKEQKDVTEKFLKEEKEFFKESFNEEKAEEYWDKGKDKAKDTAQELFNAFTDPEVQKHFMSMGIEFMLAMSALMSAMPVPDCMRDMAEKAKEARKSASDNFSKAAAGRGKEADQEKPEKIDIRPAPKKRNPPKAKGEDES